MLKKLLFVFLLFASPVMAQQSGPPIRVGATPVPIFAPANAATVTIVQTVGTSVAYTIYTVNRQVLSQKTAGSTYTFSPAPASFFNQGQALGFISIAAGTATFVPTAVGGAPIFNITGTAPIAATTASGTSAISCPGCAISSNGSGAPTGSCSTGATYTNNTNGNLYSCSAGAWQIVTTAGGGVTATAGQCPIISSNNAITGSAVCLDLAGTSGADLGAKMNNCATALPASGGICNGYNLPASQTLSTSVTTAKAVVYTFCGQAISQSAAITLTNNYSGIQGCAPSNTIFTKAASIDQITLNGANNYVQGVQLVGVSGSFTGSGIVIGSGATQSDVEFNVVAGEATNAIKSSSSSALIFDNNVSSTSTSAAITGSGTISHNFVQASQGDGIDANGNNVNVFANSVNIAVTPGKSGICGINSIADQIGDRIGPDNQISLSDSNSGDTLYGECVTPTGTHNLNMLYEGDTITGIITAGVTEYGVFVNNVNALNTNWSLTVQNVACVHISGASPACVKRTDAQNNRSTYVDIQCAEAGCALDAGTGSTADVWVWDNQPLTAATLISPAGAGSHGLCTDCTRQGIAGGTGAYLTRVGTQWNGIPILAWSYNNGTNNAASASSVTKALGFKQNPGDTILVAGECTTAGGAPTIAVSDTSNGTYTQDFAPTTDGANHYIFLTRMSNINGAISGGNTVTIASSVNVCTYVNITAAAEYTANLIPDGTGLSATGTSTAVASGALTVHQNDLVVGVGESFPNGLNPGTGCTQTCRPGTGDFDSIYSDIIGSSSGTQNMQFTASASQAWAAFAFAYKFN